MGLEITGFTRANMDKLWMDPYDYRSELGEAVQYWLRLGSMFQSTTISSACSTNQFASMQND